MKQGKGGGEREGVSGFFGTIHRSAGPTSGVRRGRGAPNGNKNAFKHGRYSKEVLDLTKAVTAWKRTTRTLLAIAKAQGGDDNRRRHKITVTRNDRD